MVQTALQAPHGALPFFSNPPRVCPDSQIALCPARAINRHNKFNRTSELDDMREQEREKTFRQPAINSSNMEGKPERPKQVGEEMFLHLLKHALFSLYLWLQGRIDLCSCRNQRREHLKSCTIKKMCWCWFKAWCSTTALFPQKFISCSCLINSFKKLKMTFSALCWNTDWAAPLETF